MVDHIQRSTLTGQIILTCIEDLALDTGLYGCIWDMPFDTYSKYVQKHSWVFACLQYMNEQKINLSISHSTIKTNRIGDQPIMQLASELITKAADLRAINRVHMALNLFHLSDICHANGRCLD